MADDTCQCCTVESTDNSRSAAGHWIAEEPRLHTELPRELQTLLGRFLGEESVETLDEWATAVREHVDGETISVEELCLTDGPTGHWGAVDGERYDFACFYDAVILAAIREQPVDIHTESPSGEVIEAQATGDSRLTVSPETAVFSFGIDESVDPPTGEQPTFESAYSAICPYVKAFPDRESYERWAARVPAATVAMPLAGATELATALAPTE